MVGQIELQNKLNNITLTTLPHSLILVGDYGCGKHTFVNELANKLKLEVQDISNDINDEKILKIQQTMNNVLYIINSTEIKEKDQNIILKLLEEPTEYSYIIILCEGLEGLLPTIINRCTIWKFNKYTNDELLQFSDNTNLFNILNTPGKLKSITPDLNNYINDTKKIFDYIDRAIISNILVLPDKLYYSEKDDNNKLNFNIFINLLFNTAYLYYVENKINLDALLLTNTFLAESKIFSIDKRKLYENYLINLKYELRKFKTNS